MNQEIKKAVCFGEVLWDNLPTGRKPGGAPMNVAYHLNRLGIQSTVISRVGRDADGDELLAFLQQIGIDTSYVQRDAAHATSQVLATIGKDNEVSYDIVAPVAWDFVDHETRFAPLASQADAFIYGSLAARDTRSRACLLQLLDQARYRLFDVNLRAPHYTSETVDLLLRRADAVKLNSHELREVTGMLGSPTGDEYTGVRVLQDTYGLREIIVTKGRQGATYYTPSARYDADAVAVQVNDTVGSGDAFLAAFLAQKLRGAPPESCLRFATMLGAFITTQSGACPGYSYADLDRFILEKSL